MKCKFTIGEDVRVVKPVDKRASYAGLYNRVGCVKNITTYKEINTIYVEFLNAYNASQEHGWFVYDERDLEKDNCLIATRWTTDDFVTIKNKIKEEKKEMELLHIYFNEKIKQLEIEHDKKRDKIKIKDPIIKEIHTLAKKYKDVKGLSIFPNCEYQFSQEILEEMNKCDKDYRIQREKLNSLEYEIKAQLDICETYEQKMNVLKIYNVVDEKGKLNV